MQNNTEFVEMPYNEEFEIAKTLKVLKNNKTQLNVERRKIKHVNSKIIIECMHKGEIPQK